MKMLQAPGQVVIPHSRPGINRGIDSRGPRLCFASLARSCVNKEGFFNFADGSAYAYTPESNFQAEVLCAALQRGRAFNLGIRRGIFGYSRGYVPPADYEQIYTFPPYVGVQPDACSISGLNWDLLVYDVFQFDPIFGGGSGTGSASGHTFNYNLLGGSAVGDGERLSVHAQLPLYTGPGGNCVITLTIGINTPNSSWEWGVLQDGISILDFDNSQPNTQPFTVGPGVSSLIEVQGHVQTQTSGGSPSMTVGIFSVANA